MSNNPHHMRNEMRRVRYLGSARSGTTGSSHMRLTSLALVPLTIAFVWLVLSLVGTPYTEAYATLTRPIRARIIRSMCSWSEQGAPGCGPQ